jgi:glycosyltransferase 2 family protein
MVGMDQPDVRLNSVFAPSANPAWRVVGRILGYLLALACLVWVFHDIRARELLRNVSTIHWGWVIVAIMFDVGSYLCQGLRWQLLLRPVGALSALKATQAIYVGLFTNEILPMRFGEFVRAYLVSRWMSLGLTSIIPSLVVERLLDGIWLAVGIGLTAIFIPLPRNLLEAGDVLGVLILMVTALFFYVVFRKPKPEISRAQGESVLWKPPHFLTSVVERLSKDLRQIGTSRAFYFSFALSFIFLMLQALAFWLIMWAYGLHLRPWVGAVVFLIVQLGTAIPNAPANVGTYQFFCVVGLGIFEVEKTLATGFSVVVFVLLTIPLWVIGFFALSHSGTTLFAIKKEISRLKNP